MGDSLLLGLGRYMIPIPRLLWQRLPRAQARRLRAGLAFMSEDHHRVRDFAVLELALKEAEIAAADLLCLSITNQRETIVVFEQGTGRPLHHAMVWQCRRGDPICSELVGAGRSDMVRNWLRRILPSPI